MTRVYSMKPDLNKLSLDQLAEYVKKQQAIKAKAAKKVIQPPKPTVKTKSTLNTIRDKILSSSGKVLDYPKKMCPLHKCMMKN